MTELKNRLSLNDISAFSLLIFPICLITGPLLAEISMNLISVIFLYKNFGRKKINFFKEKFLIYFILFYFIIILSIILSDYFNQIILKNIFYFRYIIFIYAVVDLLNLKNKLLLKFYKFLLITILITSVDGCIQFFLDQNLLGYEKIRYDRVSGFFGDDLILGSYLSRLLPLLFGLFIFNLKSLNLNETIFSLVVIFIAFFTIMISGERMAFYTICFYFISVAFFINFSKKIKFIFFSSIISLIILVFLTSPSIVNRQYQQTVDQVNLDFSTNNFFSNFIFYESIYNTAFSGFSDKKIIGQGAKSFRHFCNSDKFLNYYVGTKEIFYLNDLSKNKIQIDPKKTETNKPIKGGDTIFTYFKEGKKLNFSLSRDIILYRTNIYDNNNIGKLSDPQDMHLFLSYIVSGCTTHPHNFYLQLLAETGIVGFLFIISLWIYFIFLVCKNFIFSIVKKKIL